MTNLNKDIALVGLGKMGNGMARRLDEQGWKVRGFDLDTESVQKLVAEANMLPLTSIADVAAMQAPRLVWIMVPAGKPTDDCIAQLVPVLEQGDIVIDGGNSFYEDSIRRGNYGGRIRFSRRLPKRHSGR